MNEEPIKKGDTVNIAGLITICDRVYEKFGQKIIETEFGDFHADICLKIESKKERETREK